MKNNGPTSDNRKNTKKNKTRPRINLSYDVRGVDNYDNYKYLVGQARAYSTMLQEISNLLNEKEQNDNEGTIIDLAKRDPKN